MRLHGHIEKLSKYKNMKCEMTGMEKDWQKENAYNQLYQQFLTNSPWSTKVRGPN